MFLLSAFLCGHYILKKRIYQGKRDLCRHIIFMQYTVAFFCESKKLRPYLKERSYCFKARINRRLSIILLSHNNSITFKSLFESTTYRRGYCRRVGGKFNFKVLSEDREAFYVFYSPSKYLY